MSCLVYKMLENCETKCFCVFQSWRQYLHMSWLDPQLKRYNKQLHTNNIKRRVCHELIFWLLSHHQLRINLDILIYSVFTSISLTSLCCTVLSLIDKSMHTNANFFVEKTQTGHVNVGATTSRTSEPSPNHLAPKRCVQGRLVNQRRLTMTIWEQWNADQQTNRQTGSKGQPA